MIHVLNPLPPNRNQKPNLCAATCLQMILDRRGIEYGYSLENLAVTLGLYIDKKDKEMFGGELKKRNLPHGDARIGLLYDNFKEEKIPQIIKENFGLTIETKYPSEIGQRNVKEFLTENLKQGKDIMINYRLEPFNGRKGGHYVLTFAFNEENRDVYVTDPSPFIQEYWKQKLGIFLYGMKPIWKEDDNKKRERGFVVFSGPINKEPEDPSKIYEIIKNTRNYVPVDARIKIKNPAPVPFNFFPREISK